MLFILLLNRAAIVVFDDFSEQVVGLLKGSMPILSVSPPQEHSIFQVSIGISARQQNLWVDLGSGKAPSV